MDAPPHPRHKMVFRVNAKEYFFTYPKCPLTRQYLLEFLQGKFGDKFEWAVIAQEKHQDDSLHLHASVGLKHRYDCKNERIFDIEFDGAVYHPNVRATRNIDNANNYCLKDDEDVLMFGDIPDTTSKKRKIDYAAVINNSTNKSEFLSNLELADPRSSIFNHPSIVAYAEYRFKPVASAFESPYSSDSFQFAPPAFWDWKSEFFDRPRAPRPVSLILVGPSRIGKTALARCLGRHMYFHSMVDFKNGWDGDAEYIIFDDFGFDFIPNKKSFFGAQEEFTLTDKYSAKKSVRWGKPAIFLTNVPFEFPENDPFYEKNCVVINLFDWFRNKPYKLLY